MCPTIRVDDEVYGWLRSQAVPFDDTPNSGLRRMAGIDGPTKEDTLVSLAKDRPAPSKDYSGRRSPLARGDQLLRKWEIPAKQARFHRDGIWYEQLTTFPAAFCDPDGYVLFETEEDYKTCPQLKLGKQVNVTGGISSIPGYTKIQNANLKVTR